MTDDVKAAADKAAADEAADAAQYKQMEADARAFVEAAEAEKVTAHEEGLKVAEEARINDLVAARIRQQLAAFPEKFAALKAAAEAEAEKAEAPAEESTEVVEEPAATVEPTA